jgi:beta-glucosidase
MNARPALCYLCAQLQDELIQNAAKINPAIIVVLHGGGGFDVQDWVNQVPALLHAWFPGQYGGQALAEILFGDVNPSGKLPMPALHFTLC